MSYPTRNYSITEKAGRAELAQQLRFLAQLVEDADSFDGIAWAMQKERLTTNRIPTSVHFECYAQNGIYYPPVPKWLDDLIEPFYIASTGQEFRAAKKIWGACEK